MKQKPLEIKCLVEEGELKSILEEGELVSGHI